MKNKGVSQLISFVLYIAIAILVLSIVVTVGFPYVEKIRDSVAIKQAQDFLGSLDNVISQVALAGENSKVPVNLQFERGKYVFSSEFNELSYVIKTKSGVISNGVFKKIGPLILHADENATYVILKYNQSDLILNGFNKTLFPGIHNLIIKNAGLINNELVVEVNSS